MLKEEGFGTDCSSLLELLLAEKIGLSGHKIMFTSNDTPAQEYQKARELEAVINLDDISHLSFLENHGGLHTMIASNELDPNYFIDTAKMLFDLVVEISRSLDIHFEFINIGGGIGIPYRPEQAPVDIEYISRGIKQAYREEIEGSALHPLKLYMETGRMITGPYGYLVSRVLHIKDTKKVYTSR